MEPLRLNGVCKSYGARVVLRGFSGDFSAGRVSALIGPNGAGKTTLMRIVARLQSHDGGEIAAPAAVAYYGGFDTLPLRDTVRELRRALALEPGNDCRRLSRLSRGELQQCGLDAVLDLRPKVLLLDEPWTALEPHARRDLSCRLADVAAAGAIVICSSHDLDEVTRVATDIVFLDEGKAVWKSGCASGELVDLFADARSRAAMRGQR
jgi:ABC-type multidrug transport system ATPase subunit